MSHPPSDPGAQSSGIPYQYGPPEPHAAGYPPPSGGYPGQASPSGGYPGQASPAGGYPAQAGGYQTQPYQSQPGGYPGQVSPAGYQPPAGHQSPAAPAGPGGGILGPTAAMPVTAPRRRGRVLVPVLAALTVLLLLAAGAMTAMYVGKDRQYRDTRTQLSQARDERDQAKKDLGKARSDLEAARGDLQGSRNATAESKRQLAVISKCLDLIGQAGAAARRGDQATYNAKMKAADPVCSEADKYLK